MIGVGLRTPWSSGGLPSPAPEQPPEPAGDGNSLLGAILGPPTAGTGFQSQPGQIDWNKVAASTQRHQQQPEPPPFHYFNKGDLAVIGRASAVANIFGMHLSGLLAWLVWLFIHLIYIVEFQSRVLVFIQWGFQYLTFSRGARLITGEDPTAPPES